MGAFDLNGKLFKGLTKAGDFLILFLLWIVFSIPVITLGASTTAVYYVSLKLIKDEEGYIFKDFFKAWKQNMKQSIILELVIGVIIGLLLLDVKVCNVWAAQSGSMLITILMFAVIGLLLVFTAIAIYVFPLQAQFDNTVKMTLKNAFLIGMHHMAQTIVMLFTNAGLIYITSRYFGIILITGPLIFYINSYIFVRIFKIYIDKKNESDDEKEIFQNDAENENGKEIFQNDAENENGKEIIPKDTEDENDENK